MGMIHLDSDVLNDSYITLKAELDRLRQAVLDHEALLEHYDAVIRHCNERAEARNRLEQGHELTRRERIQQAIVAVAEQNNGVFNIGTDKERLVSAGVLRGESRDISYALGDALRSCKQLVKDTSRRGVYRLQAA